MIFDTLAYSPCLKAAGFTEQQAQPRAQANREMLADAMVTRSFLQPELARIEAKFEAKIEAAINQLRAEFRADMKELEMRLTLRMGVMLAATVAALAAIIKQ